MFMGGMKWENKHELEIEGAVGFFDLGLNVGYRWHLVDIRIEFDRNIRPGSLG